MTTALHRTCQTCDTAFLVTNAEQTFRRECGLELPDTCTECRAQGRATRNADLISMYERVEALSSGNRRTGGNGNAAANDRRQGGSRQRYNTVCAACGKETQLPFVPRGDRPVYCRDCFNARRGR